VSTVPGAEALLIASFLILVAVSAAVVISMGALSLFDFAFGRKPAVVAVETDGPPEQPFITDAVVKEKPKPKPLVADRRKWAAGRTTTGYGSHSQRVRHHN
jgi:hypothetical protein